VKVNITSEYYRSEKQHGPPYYHCCYATGLRAFLSPRQGGSQC
jgi:hypothetical protein